VGAIFAEEDVPDDQKDFIPINIELSKQWPSITRMEAHFPDADEWADVKDKRALLER
jgi:ferredoxin